MIVIGFHSLQTIRKSQKSVSILFRQESRLLTSVAFQVVKVGQISNGLLLLQKS
jgi:hypothetical protein